MEDCLPPSLVNEERPKRFFDPCSKWRSLAYPQHLQLGAVQLSVPRTESTHNWTISNLKNEQENPQHTNMQSEMTGKHSYMCSLRNYPS